MERKLHHISLSVEVFLMLCYHLWYTVEIIYFSGLHTVASESFFELELFGVWFLFFVSAVLISYGVCCVLKTHNVVSTSLKLPQH